MNRMIGFGDAFTSAMTFFKPVLELALDAGPRLQQPQVQDADADRFQDLGHLAGRHRQGEPLDDRRLAHAGLARQDRVVLPPPGQDVDHLPDLPIPTDTGSSLPAFALAVRSMVNWSSEGVFESRRWADPAGRADRAGKGRR